MFSFNRLPLYQGDRNLLGLQILKFICALMVVQIHTSSAIKEFVMPVCRIAVPVFFMISGYFMVSGKGTITSEKVSNVFIKILKITLFASIVYITIDILFRLAAHRDFDKYMTLWYWVKELLFGKNAHFHLWYLTSYLQVLLTIYILLKIKRFNLIFFLIPIGLAINLLLGTYRFIILDHSVPDELITNTLTIAIPCVAIGILVRGYESFLPSQRVVLMGLIISVILLYVEGGAIEHSRGAVLIMTIPVAVLTFVFFMRFDTENRALQVLGDWGKKYSLDIYLWHMLPAYAYLRIASRINLPDGIDTLVVILVTFGVSVLLKPSTLPDKCYRYIKDNMPNAWSLKN